MIIHNFSENTRFRKVNEKYHSLKFLCLNRISSVFADLLIFFRGSAGLALGRCRGDFEGGFCDLDVAAAAVVFGCVKVKCVDFDCVGAGPESVQKLRAVVDRKAVS